MRAKSKTKFTFILSTLLGMNFYLNAQIVSTQDSIPFYQIRQDDLDQKKLLPTDKGYVASIRANDAGLDLNIFKQSPGYFMVDKATAPKGLESGINYLPDLAQYSFIDGHFTLTTSNHNIRNDVDLSISHFADQMISSLMASQPAPLIASLILRSNSLILKTASCYLNEACVSLDTSPNVVGFNKRFEGGRLAAEDFYRKINKNGNGPKYKFEIDVLAHSMGFAYAQGFIAQIKSMVYGNRIKSVDWSGYYVIAPENGCSGSINPADGWEQIYQYGSNEATDKKYYQDGVAPQCAIVNIGANRVYIPEKYLNGKNIPKDYKSSHSIENYSWIFDGTIPSTGPNSKGYVTPK